MHVENGLKEASMNRMPGFTADFSVDASRQNSTGRIEAFSAEVNLVAGQVLMNRWAPWGPQGCIPNCICVGPDGCPCCTPEEIFGGGPRKPTWFFAS